MRKRTKTMTI